MPVVPLFGLGTNSSLGGEYSEGRSAIEDTDDIISGTLSSIWSSMSSASTAAWFSSNVSNALGRSSSLLLLRVAILGDLSCS